jgi:hypothetical protein
LQACQLRRHLLETRKFEQLDALHSPTRFNYMEFGKSILYELLPTLPLSWIAGRSPTRVAHAASAPLCLLPAVFMMEGSFSRAYHLCGYRGFLPLPGHGKAIAFNEIFIAGPIQVCVVELLLQSVVVSLASPRLSVTAHRGHRPETDASPPPRG